MKSLIMKDLYNIGAHIKSTLIVFVLLAALLLPSMNAEPYLVMVVIMCSSMILTTFAYDDACHWQRQAMVMPITRRELVLAKFCTLGILCLAGMVTGLVVGTAGSILLGSMEMTLPAMTMLLAVACAALAMGLAVGGTSMPLVFQFGPEKARTFILVSALIPAGAVALVYLLMNLLGIAITEHLVAVLLFLSPLAAILWDAAMYFVCCRIFSRQDIK